MLCFDVRKMNVASRRLLVLIIAILIVSLRLVIYRWSRSTSDPVGGKNEPSLTHVYSLLFQNGSNSKDYYNSKSSKFTSGLKSMGFERVETHEFKSPYIINPHVYGDVTRAPGYRKKKIISFHKINILTAWFEKRMNYNRDFKRCPYSECEVDVTGKMADTADVVFFLCKAMGFPPRVRPHGQLWVLGCFETPMYWYYPNYELWKDVFNITANYRLDSDFVKYETQFGWTDSSTLLTEKEYETIARQKTKTAAWWVSNCKSDRMDFVREMQKYIDVDIYGHCGTLQCSQQDDTLCRKKLTTTYKFYLAFENSYCTDYVSKKFYNTFKLRTQVIPVVKGWVDYDKYFPPDTFVNGGHFKTAKDLALYLKDLGNNIPRYAKMLQEKDKLTATPGGFHMDWCDFCEMLHTKSFGTHHDIRSWSHKGICTVSEYNI